MRTFLAVAFGLSLGCASTMSSTAGTAGTAQAASCSQVTVDRGTVVYSSPDTTASTVTTIKERSQVCADANSVGFGFRHVKLSDGKEGYVADSDLLG